MIYPIHHTFVHDLESAFYIIFWLGIRLLSNSWSPNRQSLVMDDLFNNQAFSTEGSSSKPQHTKIVDQPTNLLNIGPPEIYLQSEELKEQIKESLHHLDDYRVVIVVFKDSLALTHMWPEVVPAMKQDIVILKEAQRSSKRSISHYKKNIGSTTAVPGSTSKKPSGLNEKSKAMKKRKAPKHPTVHHAHGYGLNPRFQTNTIVLQQCVRVKEVRSTFERTTSLRLREEEEDSLVRVAMVLGKTGQVARDAAKVVAVDEDVPTWETPDNDHGYTRTVHHMFSLGCQNRGLLGSLLADLTLWMKRKGGPLIWTTPWLMWAQCMDSALRHSSNVMGIISTTCMSYVSIGRSMASPDAVTAEKMAGVGVDNRLTWNGMDTETRKADKETRFD
ncbi:hypothetical protein BC827DRAFT_1158879 [Russula dissimulans]|nr:hypothetical protein BC827DRAFT_1158879 [Russula dissimulans]